MLIQDCPRDEATSGLIAALSWLQGFLLGEKSLLLPGFNLRTAARRER